MVTVHFDKPATAGGNGKSKSGRPPSNQLEVTPYTVVVDNNEQAPWPMADLEEIDLGEPWAFSDIGREPGVGRPVIVKTISASLETGDYSIVGLEHLFTIERKSLSDLYGTLGRGRNRFAAEHERMAAMVAAGGFCCVIVEATEQEAIYAPPLESKLNPRVVMSTAASWGMKYHVPWFFAGTRRNAEVKAFSIIDWFWKHQNRQENG